MIPSLGPTVGNLKRLAGRLGASPEDLRRLAARLEAEARRIEVAMRTIGQQIEHTWWQGADAERFRHSWDTSHLLRLRQLCDQLQQTATEYRRRAASQEQTSGI